MGNMKDNDIVKRYIKSIYLDAFIMLTIAIILLIISGVISSVTGTKLEVFYIPVTIISLTQNVLQDFFFHKSIGKRIYRIKIYTAIKQKFLLLKSLIMRRFLETTYNPFLKMDFNALAYKMDIMTLTKIVDDGKSKRVLNIEH